jgi:hypothetical protein
VSQREEPSLARVVVTPRELLDLQLHVRAEQQTPAWQAGMRSAPE